jgi:predicted PolB exonuclease-like 3'-5' exonuclease
MAPGVVTHYVVFDLETAPDIEMSRRLLDLGADVTDHAVREAIGQRYSRDGQPPLAVFLKPPLHRIICAGALFAEREDDGAYIVRRLGARHIGEKSEPDLVRDFVAGLPRDDTDKGPVLVSFNGGGFDLPVLRYRALAYGAPVPALFRGANRDYWYRFGWDHIDLCDMLSGFGASARPSLAEMAALLGIPAKLDGVDGSQVEALARAGEFDQIAAYCLGDVIITFRLMLRFALIRGEIDDAQAEASEASLDAAIERHLTHWPLLAAMRRGDPPV